MNRKPYPSDVSDDEWAFVAPYLTLMTEDAPQREHSLHEVFNPINSSPLFAKVIDPKKESARLRSAPEASFSSLAGFAIVIAKKWRLSRGMSTIRVISQVACLVH
jgi:hypothetical protein